MLKFKKLIIVFFGVISAISYSKDIMIASGAGYKKPIEEIAVSYEKAKGKKIDLMFGNMGQVITFAKNSDDITFVLGDKKFLDDSGLEIKEYRPLGRGMLVLAYRKGLEISKLEDMLDDNISRITVPDTKKAIYGEVTADYLKRSGYYDKVKDKLMDVKTVPQASSYLISGEADLGFINLTNALAIQDKIGGYIVVDEDKYSDIIITFGVLKNIDEDMDDFMNFIQSSDVKNILIKYGLEE